MNQEKKPRKKFTRSPGYPMIGLEEAIGKARILWDKDKKNIMPSESVYAHLGYRHLGGYGARVIAAMKKFGLISESKKGIVLTEYAIDLMLHDSTSEEYISVVKEIALKPSIYEKLFNEYNGVLPSDHTIRIKLIKEYNFNSEKVDEFIEKFRETIDFAKLMQQSFKEDAEEGVEKDDNSYKSRTQFKEDREEDKMIHNAQSFNIPLLKQNTATLTFEKLPIDKGDLERIKQWIDLIAAPLVETEEQDNNNGISGF